MVPEYTPAAEKRLFAWFDSIIGRSLASLSESEAAVWTAYGLELQIANGGFHQALLNDGDRSQDILKALYRIGAVKIAQMYEEALTVFPGGKPASASELRYQQVWALDQAALDLLWRHGAAENITRLNNTAPGRGLMYAKIYAFLAGEGILGEIG